MLDLKYKIGDILLDSETDKLWVIVYYDEETRLYNIQEISINQVTESKLDSMVLLDEEDLLEND